MISARNGVSAPKSGRSSGNERRSWANSVGQRSLVAVLLALIVMVPLVTGTALLNSAGKLLTFEILGTILLAVAVSQVRLAGAMGRLSAALRVGPNLPLALLVGLAAVSCALSPFKAFAVSEFLRIGFCALLYVAVTYLLSQKSALQTLLDGVLFVTGVVSLSGLAEMGTEAASGTVVSGSFGTHELLGSFLMLMLPVVMALALTAPPPSRRSGEGETISPRQIAAQVVTLLAIACLLTARTRSAWLGAAISLASLSLLAVRFKLTEDQAGRRTHGVVKLLAQRKTLIVGPLLILVGAVVLFVAMSQLGPSLSQRAGTLSNVDADSSFQTRLAMWHGTLHMIAARPLFGWGIGAYPVLEQAWTHLGSTRAMVLAHGANHFNIAHNFYLQTAAELGLVGLGLYLAALAGFFAAGLHALSTMEMGLRKTVLLGCLAAMAGQVVDAIGSPAYNFASVSVFQFLLIGLGMFAAGLPARNAASVPADTEAAQPLPLWLGKAVRYGTVSLATLATFSLVAPTITGVLAANQTVAVADGYPTHPGNGEGGADNNGDDKHNHDRNDEKRKIARGAGLAGLGALGVPGPNNPIPFLHRTRLDRQKRFSRISGIGKILSNADAFRFDVSHPLTGAPAGYLDYTDGPRGVHVVSDTITAFVQTGANRATFSGTGHLDNGQPVTFTVTVQDNSADFGASTDGSKDVFTITVGGSTSLTRSSTLTEGKIMFLNVPATPA